jgi:hypothetical protein
MGTSNSASIRPSPIGEDGLHLVGVQQLDGLVVRFGDHQLHAVVHGLVERLAQQLRGADHRHLGPLEFGELAQHLLLAEDRQLVGWQAGAPAQRQDVQQVGVQRHDGLERGNVLVAPLGHLLQRVELDQTQLHLAGRQHHQVGQPADAGHRAHVHLGAADRLDVAHHQFVELAGRPAADAQLAGAHRVRGVVGVRGAGCLRADERVGGSQQGNKGGLGDSAGTHGVAPDPETGFS